MPIVIKKGSDARRRKLKLAHEHKNESEDSESSRDGTEDVDLVASDPRDMSDVLDFKVYRVSKPNFQDNSVTTKLVGEIFYNEDDIHTTNEVSSDRLTEMRARERGKSSTSPRSDTTAGDSLKVLQYKSRTTYKTGTQKGTLLQRIKAGEQRMKLISCGKPLDENIVEFSSEAVVQWAINNVLFQHKSQTLVNEFINLEANITAFQNDSERNRTPTATGRPKHSANGTEYGGLSPPHTAGTDGFNAAMVAAVAASSNSTARGSTAAGRQAVANLSAQLEALKSLGVDSFIKGIEQDQRTEAGPMRKLNSRDAARTPSEHSPKASAAHGLIVKTSSTNSVGTAGQGGVTPVARASTPKGRSAASSGSKASNVASDHRTIHEAIDNGSGDGSVISAKDVRKPIRKSTASAAAVPEQQQQLPADSADLANNYCEENITSTVEDSSGTADFPTLPTQIAAQAPVPAQASPSSSSCVPSAVAVAASGREEFSARSGLRLHIPNREMSETSPVQDGSNADSQKSHKDTHNSNPPQNVTTRNSTGSVSSNDEAESMRPVSPTAPQRSAINRKPNPRSRMGNGKKHLQKETVGNGKKHPKIQHMLHSSSPSVNASTLEAVKPEDEGEDGGNEDSDAAVKKSLPHRPLQQPSSARHRRHVRIQKTVKYSNSIAIAHTEDASLGSTAPIMGAPAGTSSMGKSETTAAVDAETQQAIDEKLKMQQQMKKTVGYTLQLFSRAVEKTEVLQKSITNGLQKFERTGLKLMSKGTRLQQRQQELRRRAINLCDEKELMRPITLRNQLHCFSVDGSDIRTGKALGVSLHRDMHYMRHQAEALTVTACIKRVVAQHWFVAVTTKLRGYMHRLNNAVPISCLRFLLVIYHVLRLGQLLQRDNFYQVLEATVVEAEEYSKSIVHHVIKMVRERAELVRIGAKEFLSYLEAKNIKPSAELLSDVKLESNQGSFSCSRVHSAAAGPSSRSLRVTTIGSFTNLFKTPTVEDIATNDQPTPKLPLITEDDFKDTDVATAAEEPVPPQPVHATAESVLSTTADETEATEHAVAEAPVIPRGVLLATDELI